MGPAADPDLARWTAHPARSRPRDVALVAAVVFLTMGAVLSLFQSAWLTVLAAIILVVSVAAFLFPTHYALTDSGVEQRRLGRRRFRTWRNLRRVSIGREAALVSPLRRPSWLDRHRGILILFDGAPRDEVVGILKEKLGGA